MKKDINELTNINKNKTGNIINIVSNNKTEEYIWKKK